MTTHPNANVVSTYTHDPEFERDRIDCMTPRARHQAMLDEHRQSKESRREAHRKGVHRMPRVLSNLI